MYKAFHCVKRCEILYLLKKKKNFFLNCVSNARNYSWVSCFCRRDSRGGLFVRFSSSFLRGFILLSSYFSRGGRWQQLYNYTLDHWSDRGQLLCATVDNGSHTLTLLTKPKWAKFCYLASYLAISLSVPVVVVMSTLYYCVVHHNSSIFIVLLTPIIANTFSSSQHLYTTTHLGKVVYK